MELVERTGRDIILDGDMNVDASSIPSYLVGGMLEGINEVINNDTQYKPIGEVLQSVEDLERMQAQVREQHEAEVSAALESAKVASLRAKCNKLSFVVITTEADAVMIPRMLSTLPKNVEVVIVLNKKAQEESFNVDGEYVEDDRIIRIATWEYKTFSFSKARNYSIELASYEWCIWIDSDDVLLPHQHADILKIPNIEPGIGGIEFGCAGYHSPLESVEGGEYYAAPHLRAFRKLEGVRFKGLIHEQIRPQIEEKKLGILRSQLMVVHLGYCANEQSLRAKINRNLSLLKLQCAANPDYLPQYYESMLARTITTYHELKGT